MNKKTADNAWIKNHNLKLILNLIKQEKEISRVEITKKLDISKSTVSLLVSYLIEKGYVEEFKSGKSGGGRKPILLRIKADNFLFSAIHIDDKGTIRAHVRDLTGNIINKETDKVDNSGELIEKLKLIIGKINRNGKIKVAVIGLPGIISYDGTILTAVNLGWENIPVTKELNNFFEFPIIAKNATSLDAFGESKLYRNNYFNNLIYIHINSVVGGGFITNGQLYNGLLGSAVEIGHIVIDPTGAKCKCGRKGCLETLINEKSIFKMAKKKLDEKTLKKENIKESNIFSWLVINENKDTAEAILNSIANDLSIALVNALNMFGADAIVIDTLLTESEYFWNNLINLVSKNALSPTEKRYQLLKSQIRDNKFLVGAAQYAEEYFYKNLQLYS